MIEARALPGDLSLEEPVAALQAISHDPSLTHLVRLRDGRRMTALEVQRDYLEQAQKFVEAARATTTSRPHDVLRRWAEVLDDLAVDPMRCADRLDWPAKLRLLEGYRTRDGLVVGRLPAAPGRPAVLRRPAGEGALQPAGGPRLDAAAAHRRRGDRGR